MSERNEITKKEFEMMENGTIFTFEWWNNEENCEWDSLYIKSSKGFIYLGDGSKDYDNLIGEIHSIDYILNDVNNTDFPEIKIIEIF